MQQIATFLACVVTSVSAAAAPVTLCKPSEKVFFSCALSNKLVSVCGQSEPSRSYLQYRAGQFGQEPELVVPKEPLSAPDLFLYGAEGRSAKGGISNLAFQNAGFSYTIYRLRHSFEPMSAGVAVKDTKGTIKYLACREPTVVDGLSELEALGLPSIEPRAIVSGPK